MGFHSPLIRPAISWGVPRGIGGEKRKPWIDSYLIHLFLVNLVTPQILFKGNDGAQEKGNKILTKGYFGAFFFSFMS